MPKRQYSYGLIIDSPNELSALTVELMAYRANRTVEQGGLGAIGHFKRICDILWPKDAKGNSLFMFDPWTERSVSMFHEHPITGALRPHCAISGCASSAKSHCAGAYGLVNWLCDPLNTFVFITSTSIADSKHRVWKSVRKLFEAAHGLPGNLVDSKAYIVPVREDNRSDDSAGIFIIAGHPSKAREGVGKMIGRKNKRVFVLADELPELSPSILEASFGNLTSNPFFQFIALGNFASRYDAFGEFVEPKDGWDSITVDSTEWECAKNNAFCIHFDGLKSPNIIAGKDLYPHIYGLKQYKDHKAAYTSEKSSGFMRFCRSFETSLGDDDVIYSESDFRMGKAYDKVIWDQGFVRVAGADPAFTNGGDRFVLRFGKIGLSNGILTLEFGERKILREDVTKASYRNRSFQMADQVVEACRNAGVTARNFGMDTTATGGPLADVIDEVWDQVEPETQHRIYRVDFSGAPTDRVATSDGKLANQKYDRRVTEIWYVGKEFLKGGQIKGLAPEMAREAKARKYQTIKGTDGEKVKAETKKDMKERLMFSPDEFEAGAVIIDLCRERHRFNPVGINGVTPTGSSSFKQLAKRVNRVYTTPAYA